MLKVVIHHAHPVKWFGQNLFSMQTKALFSGRFFRIRMKSLVSKENVVPSREGSENLVSKDLVRIKFPPKKRYLFGQRVEKSSFYGGNVTFFFFGGGGRGAFGQRPTACAGSLSFLHFTSGKRQLHLFIINYSERVHSSGMKDNVPA